MKVTVTRVYGTTEVDVDHLARPEWGTGYCATCGLPAHSPPHPRLLVLIWRRLWRP